MCLIIVLYYLVESTHPNHPDYQNLQSAVKRIREVADYVNNKKAEAENVKAVLQLQDKLVSDTNEAFIKVFFFSFSFIFFFLCNFLKRNLFL